MRRLDRDNLPYLVDMRVRKVGTLWHTFWTHISACWWGVRLGPGCDFIGAPSFHRHPRSRISIGAGCRFRSSPSSNLIGVNRPCMISTLAEGAQIDIGSNCGFSGTVIGCAKRIIIEENVKCGANTLITDTDWHSNDSRTSPDAPVFIGSNVWLGVNVTVLKGVSIGENTLIAAGSLVAGNLPPNVVAGGIPAKVLREI